MTTTNKAAKHTPGPWWENQVTAGYDDAASKALGFPVRPIYDADDTLVCYIPCDDESDANAQLIAAATDLLASCKLSLRNVESIIYLQPAKMEDSTELVSLRTWRDTLAAAIERVEGGVN